MHNWRRWFLAWDGLLPLAMSALPFLVKTFLPRNDIAEVSTAIVVTAVAALLRTAIGSYQIRNQCGGSLPTSRQLALAAAIILLMLYEGIVAILTFADDEPWSAWIFPIVFYFCYLAAIACAFSAGGNSIDRQ
jgi:hypothetical protein